MERNFKQRRAAESFAAKLRRKGLFASVFDEPVKPHSSTKRERAMRRYVVSYDSGSGLMRNPQTKMKGRAKSIRLKNFTGTVRQNPDKTITVKGLNHKAAKKRGPARKRTTKRKR